VSYLNTPVEISDLETPRMSRSFGLAGLNSSGIRAGLVLAAALGALLPRNAEALDFGGGNDITAVSSSASKDYVRLKRADGTYPPESFAFAEGGAWKGTMKDQTIDNLKFTDIAHMIAVPLASQNYIAATDPKTAKLLIMVYWGTTHAPENASDTPAYQRLREATRSANIAMQQLKDQSQSGGGSSSVSQLMTLRALKSNYESAEGQMEAAQDSVQNEDEIREKEDFLNAKMLGYDSWWEKSLGDHRGTALQSSRQDLLDELEEDRYFVVLMAYDFQLLWKEKKHKELWEVRFSIRQRHHEFDKDLPTMAQYAAQYFGQDSHGLVHKEIPTGRVEVGPVQSLGTVPGK
jgi:hypothetical protein